MEALQNRTLYALKVKILSASSPLCPTSIYIYIGEKSTGLGRAYGIKVTCNWNRLWEHIQYFTSRFENFWGTHWEQQSPQTIQLSSPPLPKRQKNKTKQKALGFFSALPGQNFYYYICLSLFQIQANGRDITIEAFKYFY